MPATYNGYPEVLLGQVNANSPNYIAVDAVFAGAPAAVWATVATHRVFVVTGICRLRMWIMAGGNVDSAGHAATVTFGHQGDPDAYIIATDEEALDVGELWYDNTPTTFEDAFANAVFDRVINGLAVGYEIAVEVLTAGSLIFHCVWEPLSVGASVVAGAGGAL